MIICQNAQILNHRATKLKQMLYGDLRRLSRMYDTLFKNADDDDPIHPYMALVYAKLLQMAVRDMKRRHAHGLCMSYMNLATCLNKLMDDGTTVWDFDTPGDSSVLYEHTQTVKTRVRCLDTYLIHMECFCCTPKYAYPEYGA